MTKPIIREECPCDIDGIRNVHPAAFPTSAEADPVDRIKEGYVIIFQKSIEELGQGEAVTVAGRPILKVLL